MPIATDVAKVTVEAPVNTYPLTYSVVNGNGKLAATTNLGATPVPSGTWVYLGTQIRFTATPDDGYRIKEWKNGDAVVNDTAETYDFEVRDTTNVTVEFEPIPLITITTQPEDSEASIIDGVITNAVLTIAATVEPSGTPAYTWYERLGAQPDPSKDTLMGTGTSLTIIPTPENTGEYYYYCVVSAQGADSVISDVAKVFIHVLISQPGIVITTQPAAETTVTEGSISASLSVTAIVQPGGGIPNHQWCSNTSAVNSGGTPIAGATSATFTIPASLTAADSPYYYYCELSAGGECNINELVAIKDPYGDINKGKAQELGYEVMPGDAWLSEDADILFPAALENQITPQTFPKISKSVRILCEAANGPTTQDCDALIKERGMLLLPDFLTNAGGVTCSYFEQVQCNMNYFWGFDEVIEKLDYMMSKAFKAVYELAKERDLYMRDAAYIIAIKRVTDAVKRRGWI
jgi:hypothetical protein